MKQLFNHELIEETADRIEKVYPPLDRQGFIADAERGLEALELKDRSAQIARALAEHLPPDFEETSALLLRAMGEDDGSGGLEGFEGFAFLPFLDYVERYGLDHPSRVLDVLEAMTLFFSAEFAVRPYFLQDPPTVLDRMLRWTSAEDWRVRRLASEGSRPRLPWSFRLKPLIEDPSPVLPILNRLHGDPHLVVRRSVANHLNDIAKDHPDLAVELADNWWSTGDEGSRWTVRHGLRTLIKQGHPGALRVLGYRGGKRVVIESFDLEPRRIVLGETIEFTVILKSQETEAAKLVVDYALHRVLKSGNTARKVFKLGTAELAPGESRTLTGRQTFKQLSTRTYYPGEHRIEILANGHSVGSETFELTMDSLK